MFEWVDLQEKREIIVSFVFVKFNFYLEKQKQNQTMQSVMHMPLEHNKNKDKFI
jgi:hypothetical protein